MINNLSSNRNYKVYRYITRITGNTGIPNLLNLDDTMLAFWASLSSIYFLLFEIV